VTTAADTTTVANQTVKDFSLPMTGGGTFRLKDADARFVVLYFYPKDNTPGCTTEGLHFRELHKDFRKAGAEVYGVSRDSLKSHEGFKSKMGFPFELISDPDEVLCQQFGVIKMKNMYGKQVRGIERSTFVIDGSGVLRRESRGVKVPNHVADVLAFVQSLA
jgi:thioredoxin-dependent peroxiredoxin